MGPVEHWSVWFPVEDSNPCTGKTTHRPTRAERPAWTRRSPMSARTPRNDPAASGTKTGCLPGSRSKVTPYPHGGATNAAHHIVQRECPIPTGRMEQPPPDRSVPMKHRRPGTVHGAMINPGPTPRANMEQTRKTNRPKPDTGTSDKNWKVPGQTRWGGRDSNPRPMDYESRFSRTDRCRALIGGVVSCRTAWVPAGFGADRCRTVPR
jgi:hypothetical protein